MSRYYAPEMDSTYPKIISILKIELTKLVILLTCSIPRDREIEFTVLGLECTFIITVARIVGIVAVFRVFYPKGRNLSRVSPKTLEKNLALMNARPKKVLNFQKPQDLFELFLKKYCT